MLLKIWWLIFATVFGHLFWDRVIEVEELRVECHSVALFAFFQYFLQQSSSSTFAWYRKIRRDAARAKEKFTLQHAREVPDRSTVLHKKAKLANSGDDMPTQRPTRRPRLIRIRFQTYEGVRKRVRAGGGTPIRITTDMNQSIGVNYGHGLTTYSSGIKVNIKIYWS